ncbi:MAG: hypothetical protein SV186_03280 [Candidatus Nanohaloarchaea archaeon]|nr:hypothetical protein [Candidatus Nanohaloarchaea archaeon]
MHGTRPATVATLALAVALAGCLGGTDGNATQVYTKHVANGNVTVWVDHPDTSFNISIDIRDELRPNNLTTEQQRRVIRLAMQRTCPSFAEKIYNSSASAEETAYFRSGYTSRTPSGDVLAQNTTLPANVLQDYTVRNAVTTLIAGESWTATCRIHSPTNISYNVQQR